MFTKRQRLIALCYGIACHAAFAIGIAAMVAGLYLGMRIGRGPFTGAAGVAFDCLLVAQFAVLHSFLLGARGRRLLAKLAPAGIGSHLTTTTFALVSSVQIAVTFLAWCPTGRVWWEAHGPLRGLGTAAFAASWILLMISMRDAGLGLQTGSLGWTSVVRGHAPKYPDFPTRGTFRYARQPIYLAFAFTLWTGPVWTPDHLLIAGLWTLYCIAGPRLKERRYLGYYGDRFARYRDAVPYWVPSVRALDPGALSAAISSTAD